MLRWQCPFSAAERILLEAICLLKNACSVLCAAVRRTACPIVRSLSEVAPGGAFVLSSGNSLAAYCKADNVRAMVDTLLRYGMYPASRADQ